MSRMQAAGRPGSAVQWGAWGGAGMALRVPGFMERMARLGLGVLQPPAGLAALAQVLRGVWRPATGQRAVVVGEKGLRKDFVSAGGQSCILMCRPWALALNRGTAQCWRLANAEKLAG